MTGARVVVVGASSGLGRSIGTGLAASGHRVAFLGRREDRVKEAAGEAGDGVGIVCDVRDAPSCATAIEGAADVLGGIDALVYSVGVGPLVPLVGTTTDVWRDVLDTNVVGASLVTAAALPHLAAAGGRAVYLSSVSASATPPWPGLGAYIVSKAALEKLIEAWRAEQPAVRFTRLVVGDTVGGTGHGATEFTSGWDATLATEYLTGWIERGYVTGRLVDIADLVRVVATLIDTVADIPSVAVTPPPA